MKFPLTVLLLVLLGAAGCAPPVSETAETIEVTTPAASTSPTATIDWFPATSTPSPAPTRDHTATPTPQLGLGELLLADDFSESGNWNVYQNANGSAGYGVDEFTLAVSNPKSYLISLRSRPELSNYYLEVNANPSLCIESDSYGLLLRSPNEWSYYRWVITCGGQTRLERVKDGFAVLVQDWIYSPQIRPGAGSELRLGAWLSGDQMRFYIDGIEQFSARDPVWTSGSIGFFARSEGDTPLTVNFSELSVYAVDSSSLPTRTAVPSISATQ